MSVVDTPDAWIRGWDATPGIVSIHATLSGEVWLWRRFSGQEHVIHERLRFRPWFLLEHLEDLGSLLPYLDREDNPIRLTYRTLSGPGALRHFVSAEDGRVVRDAIIQGITRRIGRPVTHLGDHESVLALPPDEQYLVATGRTYFRGLQFDDLHRMQFDLETTGLNPRDDRIFMIATRTHTGHIRVLEASTHDDRGEAELIREFVAYVQAVDPDVLENHNLHGFDLPFLNHRAELLRVPLTLGRLPGARLRQRGARRGVRPAGGGKGRRIRFMAPGRELIDTLDAVQRHDFAARDLPGYGLKTVAKHFGFASPDREYVPGHLIFPTYLQDPDRVRRYATDDVQEVAALSKVMSGPAFALSQMVPRRYERLADTGPATGMIDPMLVRAYLRVGTALPKHDAGDGTVHTGAALYLFASGVAHHVVKADVASLYPSLMRTYRVGPARDHLGALLAIVDGLVEQRLEAKTKGRLATPGSPERHAFEAMAAALKIVVNSAYGYLGATGLTRFSDVHAANEVTRRGREVLGLLCQELAKRGVTLLEADTDGVYFAVPPSWTEVDERRVVSEVAALLPPLIHLEFEGRYAAMLSHEPKNYALLSYNGKLQLRGVAFKSSRSEPFGETFLRQAIERLLMGDVTGVRERYLTTLAAIQNRALTTYEVSSRVRLTKSPQQYLATRRLRREQTYEALLGADQMTWNVGDKIRVYRKQQDARGFTAGLLPEHADDAATDLRDYDVDYYVKLLRNTYAQRLARAFRAEDFDAVFTGPEQLSLFTPSLPAIQPILTEYAVRFGSQ